MDIQPAIFFVCIIFIAFLPIHSEKVKYEGYKVLRFHASTPDHLNLLENLAGDSTLQLDFWTEPVLNNTVDVCVPPLSLDTVLSAAIRVGLSFVTQIENLQSLIDDEEQQIEQWRTHRRFRRSVLYRDSGSGEDWAIIDPSVASTTKDPELFYWFNVVGQYASTEEINEWLNFATYARPDLISLELVAFSYEKRPIKLAKMGVPRSDGKTKPIIWIDSGIHAREWITIATVTYIIYQFIDGYGRYPEITRMLDTYDWYLLPIHNPDGYEYSRDRNRMWRKNRAPTYNYDCVGVDLNRNYDFMWERCVDSPDAKHCVDTERPCSAIYGGPSAFSEPESRGVSNYVLRHSDRIKMFFSLHSYSQLWLLPWGYTKHPPKDRDELRRVGRVGARALENVYGTKYKVGSPAEILYFVGGSSLDWAKARGKIRYSYTLELRDDGRYGFLLPQSLIVPTANETLQGIMKAIRTAHIAKTVH